MPEIISRTMEQKIASETITQKVLYPSDTVEAGQELRLVGVLSRRLRYPGYFQRYLRNFVHF